MWQNSQGRDAARRQYQGSISRANGLHFEEIIDAGCNYYRVKGAADIEKTPEPMRPIKDMGGGKFLAVYTKAAQADYKGLLAGGRAINFEAKHTDTGRMEQSRVTEDQAERLQRCAALGGIAFVLCSFGPMDFFRVTPCKKTVHFCNLLLRFFRGSIITMKNCAEQKRPLQRM